MFYMSLVWATSSIDTQKWQARHDTWTATHETIIAWSMPCGHHNTYKKPSINYAWRKNESVRLRNEVKRSHRDTQMAPSGGTCVMPSYSLGFASLPLRKWQQVLIELKEIIMSLRECDRDGASRECLAADRHLLAPLHWNGDVQSGHCTTGW